MGKITLKIDGLNVVVNKGTSVLEAALQNKIYIPHLCYHPDLNARGACRLCIVEIGDEQLVTSCQIPVEPGMVVKTNSPKVNKIRRPIAELIINDHHNTCRGCPSNRHCDLQKVIAYLRIDRRRVRRLILPEEKMPLDTSSPCFDYDPNRCVLCGICLQTCRDIQGVCSLHFVSRGYATKIGFFGDKSRCESCGECVVRCPVGALLPKTTPQ